MTKGEKSPSGFWRISDGQERIFHALLYHKAEKKSIGVYFSNEILKILQAA